MATTKPKTRLTKKQFTLAFLREYIRKIRNDAWDVEDVTASEAATEVRDGMNVRPAPPYRMTLNISCIQHKKKITKRRR